MIKREGHFGLLQQKIVFENCAFKIEKAGNFNFENCEIIRLNIDQKLKNSVDIPQVYFKVICVSGFDFETGDGYGMLILKLSL